MLTRLARLLGIAEKLPGPAAQSDAMDYKFVWNQAAAADAHDAILTGSTAESFESSGQSDAAMVGRYLRGEDVVLNIGCGAGRVERYLAPKVRELWAVDVSGEMLRLARKRLEGLPNVRLREVGNRDFLSSFETERFDLVFSFLVLQHLEKEDAFLYLRDAWRVLKPGGTLVTQFPNYLSPAYTHAFVEGAAVGARSPGRIRASTEAEVRHTLAILNFAIADLWYGSHGEATAEIYVAARKLGQ